jgi:hypothetical protein
VSHKGPSASDKGSNTGYRLHVRGMSHLLCRCDQAAAAHFKGNYLNQIDLYGDGKCGKDTLVNIARRGVAFAPLLFFSLAQGDYEAEIVCVDERSIWWWKRFLSV